MDISHVADNEFEAEVIRASMPVLVDFWGSLVRPVQIHRAGAGRACAGV